MTDPTITIAGLRATIEREYYREQACTMAGEIVELQAERRGHAAERQSLTAERDALAAQLAEVRAELAAAPKVCAIHSYALEGPCMTCGAPWPGAEKALRQERVEGMEKMLRISRAVGCPNSVEEVVEAVAAIKSDLASERAHLAACQTRIAGLEQAADERSKEVARVDALFEEARGALVDVATALNVVVGVASPDVASRCRAEVARLTARVAELEARPVLTAQSLCDALVHARAAGDFLHVPAAVAADVANRIVTGGSVTLPAQDRAEELAAQIQNEAHALNPRIYGWTWDKLDAEQRSVSVEATRRAMRAALTARGIPVTPEVGK